jgi:hypothetical protein
VQLDHYLELLQSSPARRRAGPRAKPARGRSPLHPSAYGLRAPRRPAAPRYGTITTTTTTTGVGPLQASTVGPK